MVSKNIVLVVLLSFLLIVTIALRDYHPVEDFFTGLCVISKPGFSLLYNGSLTVATDRELEVGGVYLVVGRLRRTSRGLWMDVAQAHKVEPDFKLERIEGAYWDYYGEPSLLTPSKIHLSTPINASRGEMLSLEGIFWGRTFYPLKVEHLGFSRFPRDGMPYKLRGVVLNWGNPALVWNGSEEFKVYLPHGTELGAGKLVEVVGVVRLHSTITIYVDFKEDVKVVGEAERVPVDNASYGMVATGTCLVLKGGKYLNLNCTELRLRGFKARTGDVVHFEALRLKSTLRCLKCRIVRPREEMPNSICSFSSGRFGKIGGRVEWVRKYRNGFGIANITNGTCWVLLKLPSSLGVTVEENESVSAYGFFTTYRGEPAFQVQSGDDLCSGKRC